MNAVAGNHLSFEKNLAQWPDMLRVAGPVHTATGYDLLLLGAIPTMKPTGAPACPADRAGITAPLALKIGSENLPRGWLRHPGAGR
jgi:hypothetical protein